MRFFAAGDYHPGVGWFHTIPDLSKYDVPIGRRVVDRELPSAENEQVQKLLLEIQRRIDESPALRRIDLINEIMDQGQVPDVPTAESRGLAIRPVGPFSFSMGPTKRSTGLVSGEWIVGPACDPSRRLLYIHGGGFVGGSPQSHRALTMALAERTGMSILSIQYRMMPKKSRLKGLADVRAAYAWMLANGPNGVSKATSVAVSGDSAGGNLALMLLQWARDTGRARPDACVAFSPVTDVGLNSPSSRTNFEADVILGEFFARIHRVPALIRGPLTDLFHGGVPGTGHRADPMISPVFGQLHDLPPTLLQGSESELLRDDANRYANKAREAGSEVDYQTWPGMVHVFQMFEPILPEADEALQQVCQFLERHQVIA